MQFHTALGIKNRTLIAGRSYSSVCAVAWNSFHGSFSAKIGTFPHWVLPGKSSDVHNFVLSTSKAVWGIGLGLAWIPVVLVAIAPSRQQRSFVRGALGGFQVAPQKGRQCLQELICTKKINILHFAVAVDGKDSTVSFGDLASKT